MYVDLMKYIAALKINVDGRKLELQKFNADFTKTCSSVFASALQGGKLPYVKKDKRKNIEDFFSSLNCVSGSELVTNLTFYETQLKPDADDAMTAAKKSSVYVKLGLLIGAMVGILFL